jgi:hypothetical protein
MIERMDAHERATTCCERIAGLLRRKDLAIDIIEWEIRSAQREVLLEAARLVLTNQPVVEITRQLREAADKLVQLTGDGAMKRR